ncbi:hypothetical protein MPTK1_8g02080 [Marchantia polymorpha subsp. ruderalis]|uniref:Uncharacterized protein n=1 Tax=Marchantia polymorpha TaxID=3197 RepID=A0A2R6XIW2_MARPO|nr:hypothetical protein MARPO_0012s0005 [Marchantia polymorpha]BBN18375.1 hypothetical protein Mp_8g02080 [Marchantia polymorpha subsp. ruderalis]|eukprot:PTQ46022.1 hypothetical protein MARPO_0012s0005 [Marchantia polymorpha]
MTVSNEGLKPLHHLLDSTVVSLISEPAASEHRSPSRLPSLVKLFARNVIHLRKEFLSELFVFHKRCFSPMCIYCIASASASATCSLAVMLGDLEVEKGGGHISEFELDSCALIFAVSS